jgi:hypothetical protein
VGMIGASVHGVRPPVGKEARRAVTALVQVGCFTHTLDEEISKAPILRFMFTAAAPDISSNHGSSAD